MPSVTRNEHLKAERNKSRFFAAELVDALRGRHPNALIIPVVTGEIDEPEKPQRDNKQKFRVLGAYKGSKWSKADYAALVFSPNWVEPDGTYYNVKLAEPDFERVRDQLRFKGLTCGLEVFSRSARAKHSRQDLDCEMCALLAARAQVYVLEDEVMVRNRAVVSKDQAEIADALLEAATIATVMRVSN